MNIAGELLKVARLLTAAPVLEWKKSGHEGGVIASWDGPQMYERGRPVPKHVSAIRFWIREVTMRSGDEPIHYWLFVNGARYTPTSKRDDVVSFLSVAEAKKYVKDNWDEIVKKSVPPAWTEVE